MACNRITRASPARWRGASDPCATRPVQPDRLDRPCTVHHLEDHPLGHEWATPEEPRELGDRDSEWEAEFCRVAESHPKVVAYTKNHNLGFEIPYRYGSEVRRYRPDFIVLVDDGHRSDDLLRVVVETKGYRREDAKDKKDTMETYWVPGVNNLGEYGRWTFVELTDVYRMESDLEAKVRGRGS